MGAAADIFFASRSHFEMKMDNNLRKLRYQSAHCVFNLIKSQYESIRETARRVIWNRRFGIIFVETHPDRGSRPETPGNILVLGRLRQRDLTGCLPYERIF